MIKRYRLLPSALAGFLARRGLLQTAPNPVSGGEISSLYRAPLPPPGNGISVFHIGHSLVGQDMPAFLAQLSGSCHRHNGQVGWGTTLKAHWEPRETITGLDLSDPPEDYRDAHDAIGSGEYDAVVATEMVEIRDAIRYFDSWDYLSRWARKAWNANPETRVYLYETWHWTNDPEGWLTRLDLDLARYWEREILDRALAVEDMIAPIYVIPGGQVMAAMARALEATGGVDGLASHEDLLPDKVHFNDLGAYLMALTHYAVLYGRDPAGLPHELLKAHGTPAEAPSLEAAQLMQRVVWEVVTGYPRTGVRKK